MYFKNLQNIIDILRRKKSSRIRTEAGYLHLPIYPSTGIIYQGSSGLYNEHGERLDEFFVRDAIFSYYPYRFSRYFIWDRFNYSLKIHFYTHSSILEPVGNPDRKYACFIESEEITPHDYKIFDKHKGLNKDFDLIFTHSADLLEKYDNARFVPFCASFFGCKLVSEKHYEQKSKGISILSSQKELTPLNTYRLQLARECRRDGIADAFGTFDGGSAVPIQDTLKDYRYSFCIENAVKPYFFTERIICAFANQTIPIYLGATKIDKFFNPDGIIKITTKSDIKEVIKQCTKEEYERRLPAILDNYVRCQEYVNSWDYMYEKYFIKDKQISV